MKRFEATFGDQVFTRDTNREYKFAVSWQEPDGTYAKPSFCAREDLAKKVKCPSGRNRIVVECRPSTKRIARAERTGKIDVHFYLDAEQYQMLADLSAERDTPIAKICRASIMKEINDPLSFL